MIHFFTVTEVASRIAGITFPIFKGSYKVVFCDIISLFIQLGSIIVLPMNSDAGIPFWVGSLSLVAISFGWWMNYINKSFAKSDLYIAKLLYSVKQDFQRTRFFTNMLLAVFKPIVFFLVMACCWELRFHGNKAAVGWFKFAKLGDMFKMHKVVVSEV